MVLKLIFLSLCKSLFVLSCNLEGHDEDVVIVWKGDCGTSYQIRREVYDIIHV